MKNLLELYWENHPTLQAPAYLKAWLLDPGSFMQRLSDKGALNPRIHILSEEWQYAEPWEHDALNIASHAKALVREVLILSDQHHWMFARTILPKDTLTGEEAVLAHLNTRSLGTVLFNHPDMTRSAFAFARISPETRWYQKIKNSINEFFCMDGIKEIWSRYSIFHLQEKKLLLTEVFLPDIAHL